MSTTAVRNTIRPLAARHDEQLDAYRSRPPQP
jgi:hypothetical protein